MTSLAFHSHRIKPGSPRSMGEFVSREAALWGRGWDLTDAQIKGLLFMGLSSAMAAGVLLGVKDYRARVPLTAGTSGVLSTKDPQPRSFAGLKSGRPETGSPETGLPDSHRGLISGDSIHARHLDVTSLGGRLETIRLDRLNRSDRNDLMGCPGIGAALANRILAARQVRGEFDRLDRLYDVAGLGPTLVERIRNHLDQGIIRASSSL